MAQRPPNPPLSLDPRKPPLTARMRDAREADDAWDTWNPKEQANAIPCAPAEIANAAGARPRGG